MHARVCVFSNFYERRHTHRFTEREMAVNLVPLESIKPVPTAKQECIWAFVFVNGPYRYTSNLCQQEEDNDLVDVSLEG